MRIFFCVFVPWMLSSWSFSAESSSSAEESHTGSVLLGQEIASGTLQMVWRPDGKIDVLSTEEQSHSKSRQVWRLATVTLKGIRVEDHNGQKQLILETRDEPLHLGALASMPCTGQKLDRDRMKCVLVVGESPPKRSQLGYWTLSLIIGEEGGVASETRFTPMAKPQPWSPNA
jgi:hypothetical protein